jgi:hypothetical protein
MSEIKPQIIKFIQACPPALDDGEYRIEVEQNVILPPSASEAADTKTLSTVQEFSVKGPRFEINPEDTDSVFPPANQTGCYSNCLPHIVINRKTFAWERDVFAKKSMRAEADNKPIDIIPWVAVLSFSKEEAPELKKNTVNAIINPETNVITGNIALDEHIGEVPSTPCITIDIPSDLFNKIAPSLDELAYLAHARYVEMDKKDPANNKEGYYCEIISNRFPLASDEGETNISHLVSLEGLGEYMPGGSKAITDPNKKVRLISLTSWQYSVKTEHLEFQKLIKNLSAGMLSIPVADEKSQQDVKNALDMGFMPLKHNLRNGEKTVSWYRGPFAPINLTMEAVQCYPCADALLRYNPNTGMFDLSYATAWQIGRMLALQNKSFASDLFRWRRQNNQKAAFLKMRETLRQKLGESFDYSGVQADKLGDTLIHNMSINFVHKHLGPRLKALATDSTNPFVKLGDASGLLRGTAKLPGLLTENELKDIIENSQDPISTIIQKVKEKS